MIVLEHSTRTFDTRARGMMLVFDFQQLDDVHTPHQYKYNREKAIYPKNVFADVLGQFLEVGSDYLRR